MKFLATIPALPVRSVRRSAIFYSENLGFQTIYEESGFAVLHRDTIELHLWAAYDEDWQSRRDTGNPVESGAESFIAGTASCRIIVQGIEEIYTLAQSRQILHPNGALKETPWGALEFTVLDPDNNAITFQESQKQK